MATVIDKIYLYDVKPQDGPKEVGTFNVINELCRLPTSMFIHNGRLYLLLGWFDYCAPEIAVINIVNPSAPYIMQRYPGGQDMYGPIIVDSTMFLLDSQFGFSAYAIR